MNVRKYLSLGLMGALAVALLASCYSKPSDDRPNILFAIADDQSFPHAGAYGCTWVRTPAFDRVAKEGLLFMRAYTPNAKCAPSRACILTGRNSWQLEQACNHWPYFPEKFVTFPEVLASQGYSVGRTGKGWAPGIATRQGQPRELIGHNYVKHKLDPPAAHISDNDYAKNFRDFLRRRDKKQPFFFWYGAIEPHRRYAFNVGVEQGGKQLEDITEVPPHWPSNDTVKTDMLDYAYEVEHFDQHLDKMLTLLEKKGLLENTLVVVTSDNGMPFPRVKGNVFEFDNHLPLAMRWGRGIKNPGRVVQDYVNFIDFAPTFLQMAAIDGAAAGMQPITGSSLLDLFADVPELATHTRDHVLIGKERHDVGRPNDQGYPVRGIVTRDYAYHINFKPDRWPAGNPVTGYLNTDGSPTKTSILAMQRKEGNSQFWQWSFGKRPEEELFDLRADPWCLHNLSKDSSLQHTKQKLRDQLLRELSEQGDPRVLGNGDVFDNYLYADKTTSQFYNRFMQGEKLKAGWVNPGDFEKVEPE